MPGWHDATKDLVEKGDLRLAALIEEQHPDRCRLFLDWKGIDMPVMVDALGLLGVEAVPITLLIDEHGVIRGRVRSPDGSMDEVREFVATAYDAPDELPEPARPDDPKALAAALESAEGGGSAAAWMRLGDARFLRGDAALLTGAIEAYEAAIERGAPESARFRRGVALRARFESPARRPGDFQAAVDAWSAALAARPSQYIWRRRIQQYGPRLDKPYPFYDWVATARREIIARGDVPPPLGAEPRGAEIARPEREFEADTRPRRSPDPDGRIPKDADGLVRAEAVVVPSDAARGETVRVHVTLTPDETRDVHWNDEAGEHEVWVDPPAGVEVDRRGVAWVHTGDGTPDDTGERTLEFEARIAEDAATGEVSLDIFALYYVCEGVGGVCIYLRRDIEAKIRVR